MTKVYNNAGDLLVCAFKMMNKGKTAKALECAELALKLPSMRVIASGLEQMNRVHAEEELEDIDNEIEVEDEVEESSDETEEDIDLDIEDVEEENASDDEEDEEIDTDEDIEEENASDDDEDEEIDEEELDEVLSYFRKQYNVKSSIVTAKRKAAKAKCSKKVKACGTKPSNSDSSLPLSTMAKLRGLVNKSAIKSK